MWWYQYDGLEVGTHTKVVPFGTHFADFRSLNRSFNSSPFAKSVQDALKVIISFGGFGFA
jgi:hypothetical protein